MTEFMSHNPTLTVMDPPAASFGKNNSQAGAVFPDFS